MPATSTRTQLCFAAILLASALVCSKPARADDFPEGPGKAELMKICTVCHDLDAVLHLSYGRKDWQALVSSMQDNGADGTPREIELIVDYLTKNFGKETAAANVNVNKATASEIEKGLGLTTQEATAIVEYRTKNGAFKTLDDVKKVAGVDAKKLDAARDRMTF